MQRKPKLSLLINYSGEWGIISLSLKLHVGGGGGGLGQPLDKQHITATSNGQWENGRSKLDKMQF